LAIGFSHAILCILPLSWLSSESVSSALYDEVLRAALSPTRPSFSKDLLMDGTGRKSKGLTISLILFSSLTDSFDFFCPALICATALLTSSSG
jgi:hypothetical protein